MATIMDHPHTVDMGIIIEVVMEVITRISLRDKIEEAIEVEEAVEAAEDAVIAAAIDNDLIRQLGFIVYAISRVRAKIPTEHIQPICSSDSQLFFILICSIRILPLIRDMKRNVKLTKRTIEKIKHRDTHRP